MELEHLRQVLLVEDQPFHHKTISRRLKQAGYNVILAKNYSTAQQLLENGIFHLAIIDICLDRTAGKNEEGLRLLEDIEKLGLRKVMPSIVLTAYGTEDRAIKALIKLGARNYIRKEPGYLGKLEESVNDLFQKEVAVNFGIQYEGDSFQHLIDCANDIYAGEEQLPSADKLLPELQDLMGRVFIESERLRIQRVPKGQSGSAVLRVQPTYRDGGLGQWLIVKVGRRDKTEIETKNYHSYVEHFLPANHATQFSVRYTRHLGGIVYTLNADLANISDFREFYQQKSSDEIKRALQRLFRDTCALWYENRSAPRNCDLRDLYLDAFDLKRQPDRIPDEITRMHPDLNWNAERVPLNPSGGMLPNPLCWLKQSEAGLLPVSECTTHGDLHAGNILINDAGECWLIDFYRTRKSHILRDVAKMEVDIKFTLLPVLSLEEYCRFERALLQTINPSKGNYLRVSGSPPIRKTAEVLAGLRNEAWLLLGGQRAGPARQAQLQYEYLFSLLMTTLNVLRLRHYKENLDLQPYRERALLSAALICEKLEQLRKD